MTLFGRLLNKVPNHTIRIDGQPYLTRYYLTGPNTRMVGEGPALFLHHFHMSDQGRELHNHPYTGTSLILSGGYIEERVAVLAEAEMWEPDEAAGPGASRFGGHVSVYSNLTSRVRRVGDINRLGLNDFHRTELLNPAHGAWTLFYTGPRVKEWGFLDRSTLEFFPYESTTQQKLGSGPYARDGRSTEELQVLRLMDAGRDVARSILLDVEPLVSKMMAKHNEE